MVVYQERTHVVRPCRADGADGTIVVCARDRETEAARYRLPLPEETKPSGERLAGERPRASAEPVRVGGCNVVGGVAAGCTKPVEMVKIGGTPAGANPLGFVMKLTTILVDPDSDVEPPVNVPERFRDTP